MGLLLDRMEAKGSEFHRKVRGGYLEEARLEPDRYAVLDARGSENDVFRELLAVLEDRLAGP